jgi:hypothetical protein
MQRQFVKKLPVYHQTDTQKQFFAATFDQLFNPSQVDAVQGYIGRKSGGIYDVLNDTYLAEPTNNRANYQLEPIAYTKDPNTLEDTNHVFYEDLVNKLRFYGSNTGNHDRLFSDDYYSFAPPIDIDKYTNFGNYIWIDEDITPVFITSNGNIDTLIESQILGASQFNTSNAVGQVLSPPNFQFTNGVRVRFENAVIYTETYTVTGVGTGIELLGPITAQTPDTVTSSDPWDNVDVSLEWDNFLWAAGTVAATAPKKSHITIEKGACDGNVWSRTNRWVHIDAIDAVQRVGQIISITLVNAGQGYVIGDTLDVVGDGIGGRIEVTGVGGLGEITDFVILNRGSGYSIATLDQTGVATTFNIAPWDSSSLGAGTEWDAVLWDQAIAQSGTGAIFDIELASAIDKTNRAERPIIEYKKNIELYDHGRVYLGEVDLAAVGVTPADIVGQTDYVLDGIALQNGMLIIFQTGDANIEQLPWDETPPGGIGTMSNWDTSGWAVNGLPEAITKFIWQISGVGTGITITKYQLPTMTQPAVPLGGSVLVTNGVTYAGVPFYQGEDDFLGTTWLEGQTTAQPNTHPKFVAYDYQGIRLDDTLEYPASDFVGNEIFSYRIYDGEDIEDGEIISFDRVLEFQTIRKNLGQVGDILFENDLETVRSTYITPSGRKEIPGYYFYKIFADCDDSDGKFFTNWLESTVADKQRFVESFLTTTDTETLFRLDTTPYNNDVYVRVGGRRLGVDEFEYDAAQNAIILNVAPAANTIVEAFVYTLDRISDNTIGYFEIPSGLENNPTNEEITVNSWNDFVNHFVSIIENQENFTGEAFGRSNNYRDSARDGSVGQFILQNQAPLLKAMLMMSSDELDLVEAMRFSSREYSRFKNKLLKTAAQLVNEGYTPFNQSDPIVVNQWLDEAIRRIIQSREFASAFEDTYMISWTSVYEEEELTGNSISDTLTVTSFVDLEDRRNSIYIYKNGELLLQGIDYEVVNLNPIQIRFEEIPLTGDDILARLYTASAPAHIPATPAKLGITQATPPRIEVDNTYRTPTEMIVGHDGSRTPTFGDFRDDILLEFEKRVYNGLQERFLDEYLPAVILEDVAPSANRPTRWRRDEYEGILRQSFFKWSVVQKVDYRTNTSFDPLDPWTWNYSSLTDVDGNRLPGYWRGLFDYFYGTQTPHLTPWEMLGFAVKPDWWEEGTEDITDGWTGYGVGPWPAGTQMWEDIENGIIRRGERAGTDERFTHPGLVADYLPVDGSGNLKTTPLECVGIIASITLDEAAKDWSFGDLAPVEYAWRTSEVYDFAVAETLFLTKPGAFGEKFFNAENFLITPANENQIVSLRDDILKRLGNDVLTVHGETVGGELVLNTGYQVWITSHLKRLNRNIGNEFGEKIRALNVKLGHKMAGFTDRDSARLYVEGVSVNSRTANLLVPLENLDLRLFTGAPVKEYFYGGVLIQKTESGRYRIFGYDILKNTFSYIERKASPKDRNINIAGKPEPFTNYESGRIYEQGQIVRLNGQYYRCLTTHEATRFEPNNWQKLSSLPVRGGVNVTYKPLGSGTVKTLEYGDELTTEQEVFDFLIGYGDFLTQEGWLFENVNTTSNTVENWLNAGKEFLFWAASNWEAGNVIAVSPAATSAVLEVKEGYPMAVEKIINGVYSILDQNGMAIDPSSTKVRRNDRRIEVIPTLTGQEVYALRVNTAETETILTIDNTTEFNDVLYDPVLGTRQPRLFFNGRKTTDWTGKLEAAGFIITENGMLPNFENLVDSVRFYHDTERTIYSPRLDALARHLTGYNEKDYLNGLDILDDAQYHFYQGMIKQKGTKQSIAKLERSDAVTALEDELTVHEEWALKLGEFGGVSNKRMTEFLLRANLIKVDPQLVELSYEQSDEDAARVSSVEIVSSGATYLTPPPVYFSPDTRTLAQKAEYPTPATAALNSDGTLASITVIDDRGLYTTAPTVLIGTNVPADIDENSDRAVAILQREITPDISGDDIITIDIDDNEHWVTKPSGVATDIPNRLWPTTSELLSNVPRAGYAHYSDVTHTVFDIANVQGLWFLPNVPVEGSRIWTAKAENKDWSVYECVAGPTLLRQYNAGEPEYTVFGIDAGTIAASGGGYTIGDIVEIRFDASTGIRALEFGTIEVTSVSGGAVLDFNIVTPGAYVATDDVTVWPFTLPLLARDADTAKASPLEINVSGLSEAEYDRNFVSFNAELPYSNTLRYLTQKIVVNGIVYDYTPITGSENMYWLTVQGEAIPERLFNDTGELATTSTLLLYNARFRNEAEYAAAEDNDVTTLIWLDDDGTGKWAVKNTSAGTILSDHRNEEVLVDTSRFDGAFLYDSDTKETLVQLPVYDPYKGIFPGIADNEIRHRSPRDPARYNRTASSLSDPRLYRPTNVFGPKNVGELWWDTSTCAYPLYEQGDDRYRRDNWGQLFPGSVVDIYEWTRSPEPPAEYEDGGTPRNLTDYVELREWDPLIEEIRTFYYFWVKNVPVSPGTKNRKLSASEVSRIIRNPRTQLYRWYSPVSQTGFVFSGVDGVYTDSDNIFQINFRQLDNDNKRHVEWELGSETNPSYRPRTSLWEKMVDSLVGFTNPVPIGNSTDGTSFPTLSNFENALPVIGNTSMGYLIVPDPALSEFNRYGVRRRPQQTMFRDRQRALKIFVQVANELLADIRLRDENPNWNSSLPSNDLWEWQTWFETGFTAADLRPTRQVANVGSLSAIDDAFPGEVVKVMDTLPSYYSYNPETELFTLIAKEDVRLVLKDEIYENAKNLSESLEIRALIETLKNNIFNSPSRAEYINRIFFSMLNYVFKEQEDLDWAFKTTFVTIEQKGKPVRMDRVFQADPYDNVLEYMNEVKPYQTKIRDYKVARAAETDVLNGTVTELERLLTARLLYDRFTCSLTIEEIRIAKAAAIADAAYDGYNDLFKGGVLTEIRLGAAGRFVIRQTDLLGDILYVDSDTYEDYIPQNAYWDANGWDEQSWDGSAGTTPAEIAAVAEINRRLCEEMRSFFEGVNVNSTTLLGGSTTEPWDSVGWDALGWDANEEPGELDILDASLDGTFAEVTPEDSFVGNDSQKEFILTSTAPSFLLFAQVFNLDGQAVSTQLNVDYFFIGGRLVFVTAPPTGYTVNVYTYLEAGDLLNPEANSRVTEEMVPLDPRESLVIVADTVDDPITPTVSYSFRIHYDTMRNSYYLRNDTPTMTTIASPVGYTDTTIAVADVSVLEEQPTTFETPNIAWICNERIVFHGVDPVNNLLLGVQRGTLGTPLAEHDVGCKVFAGGPDQEIPNPEVYWVSPAATNAYSGTDGIWRDNADGTAIFSDGTDNAFAANADPSDAIVISNTNASGTYAVRSLIAAGSLSTVTITTPGTGYEIGDTIDITGAGNGTAVVGAIGTDGVVTAVTITDFGTGYVGVSETMTSAAGDGTFEATVVTDRQAVVLAHPAPTFTGAGRVVEANSITWQLNTSNAGGLLASTTGAASFILLQQGDALPCCAPIPEPDFTPEFNPAALGAEGGAFIDQNGDLWYSGSEGEAPAS